MFEGIKFWGEEEEPDRVAAITFHGDTRINHPLAKQIKLYEGNRFLGFEDYSDVKVEELREMGFTPIDKTREFTLEMPVISTFEGGTIEVE